MLHDAESINDQMKVDAGAGVGCNNTGETSDGFTPDSQISVTFADVWIQNISPIYLQLNVHEAVVG